MSGIASLVTSRRQFLQAGIAVAGSRQTGERPNLVFILTDDQRFDALGCVNARIITPNMDSLARRGVRFTNAFVSTSVCSASRAACLTGRYGSANGVPGLGGGLRPGEKLFVSDLKNAGYRTGLVGKWHLNNPRTPKDGGFDYDVHFVANGPHFDRNVIEDSVPKVARGFIEDYLAGRAVEFIEAAVKAKEPFFLNLCTQVPHMDHRSRWVPRPETLAKYEKTRIPMPANARDSLEGKPAYLKTCRHRERGTEFGYDREDALAQHVKEYYASITDLDTSLGKVLSAVDQLGLRGNTYVILMGDNGWFLGEHGFSSKVLPYEESIRVPCIISGPELNGRTDSRPVMNIDIAPTLLELAGLTVPSRMHGRSLKPLIDNRTVDWRTNLLYEALVPTLGSWPLVAIRTERWKYIQTFDISRPDRLVFEELYDLRNDQSELRNVVAANREVLQGLRRDLDVLRDRVKS